MRDEERGEASSKRARRAPQRILLIEPDPVLGLALSAFLAGYFGNVALAASDAAARSLLTTGPGYDVIIADEDAGPAVLAACVASAGNGLSLRPRRLILLRGERGLPLPAGVHRVLTKPVPASVLLSSVDASLGPGLHKAPATLGQAGQHLRR